jgi:two-component system, chemotaxis family, protein-glutamate methylesterase/glutaminase
VQYDVVNIVCATRGLGALSQVLSQLPSTFGTPIVCLAQSSARTLDELQAATRLRVRWAEAGVPLEKGCVYISRPGSGLVWRPDGMLSVTPVSIDATAHNPVDHFLASSAPLHGPAAACLILAGLRGDGVAGSAAIKQAGGTVLVLDRATASHWGLAEPIVRAGAYDRVLTLEEASNALRACFTGCDLLRCAEIQIRLGAILDAAMSLSGTHMGHITRKVKHTNQLQILVHRGLGVRFLERFDPIPIDSRVATGRAYRERTRVVVSDVLDDPGYAPWRDAALESGIRAVHATPIPPSGKHEAQGVLTTLFVHPHTVSLHEARDLDTVANDAHPLVAAIG